jgi:hypothetical protein
MPTTRLRTNLVLRLLISLGLIGALLPFAPGRVEAADEKPTLLGFASADPAAELPGFVSQAGRPPALAQLFWDLGNWDSAKSASLSRRLDELEDLGVTAYVEITTNSLAGLNQGGQDANLNGMAEGVAAWLKAGANRHILIAPLPEMNLSHHAWGGNPSGFKTGYAHIRGAFLDQGLTPSQIRFVFAPNGTSDVGEFNDYYPGGATVDVIGFARLNRGDPWLDYNAVFRTHIDDLQARVSLARPILVTQTGSLTHASRAGWLGDMFTNLKANPQVIGAIYFNRNKDHDYRVLVNGVMDSAFRSGYQNWSNPNEVDWIFDGRMDAWVQARAAAFSSGFIDIQGHIFQNAITWLSDQGITEGCNPPNNTRFCPQDLVTRGQMAVFIARALGLPAASGDHFADDAGRFYEGAANKLFEAGITVGCAENRYCGEEQIPRAQMAAFLARILHLPATTTDHFIDDAGTFEAAINKLAEAGITAGCNPERYDRFCPTDPVTRGQMATFLRRALG